MCSKTPRKKTVKNYEKLLEAAQYYMSLGWSVIPVGVDKIPTVNWKKYQQEKPSEEEVSNWFTENSNATGVAIITGKVSGLIVLDYEAGQAIPKLPPTATVITGGGGKHFYFSLPDDTNIRSSARTFGKDYLMDIRAEAGYVLAPPSLHKSGKLYEWELNIANHDLAKLPDILKIALHNTKPSKAGFTEIIEGVAEGNRHDTAVRLVGLLLNKFDPVEWSSLVWPMLKGWNLQNQPAMDLLELQQIFSDIKKRELSKRTENYTSNVANTISLDELMAEPDTEPDWLVDRLIPHGGITILAGKARNFKTWILLHLALSVATAEKVFGHFNSIQAPVLIVDEENQKKTLRKRLAMLGYRQGTNLFFRVQTGFKITNKHHMKDLIAFVKAKNIQLVIFDSLVRVHDKDENTSTGMAEVFAIVKQLNRIGAAILFTHHNRKQDGGDSAQGMRGSSDILAAADAQMSVERHGEFIVVEQNKNRDAEELTPFSLFIKSDEETMRLEYQGESLPKLDKLSQAEMLIIDTLRSGAKSRTEIVEQLVQHGIGHNRIGEALKNLVLEQKVEEQSGERNKKQYRLLDVE